VAAALVIAAIYIALNSGIAWLAGWLERRTRRVGRTTAPPVTAPRLSELAREAEA
jgi:glutamate transport system permease protein